MGTSTGVPVRWFKVKQFKRFMGGAWGYFLEKDMHTIELFSTQTKSAYLHYTVQYILIYS